jgi:predicted GH43/DUF377 family glycosyl hydrolase
VALALTKDFHCFESYGVIMQQEDSATALLPRRIDSDWVLINGPVSAASSGYLDTISTHATCGTGVGIRRCPKRDLAVGGMRIKLVSPLRR